jgi:hypothetical protein
MGTRAAGAHTGSAWGSFPHRAAARSASRPAGAGSTGRSAARRRLHNDIYVRTPGGGQHRNRALAAARRAKAVELRTAGLTYDQIAVELGYANRGTIYRVVAEALKAQTAEAIAKLRSLEVERLDHVQLAMWQRAMDGNVPSATAVVRCIMARCRLLGLDGPSLLGREDPRPRTLVVPPEI